jgi:hypothetical protein
MKAEKMSDTYTCPACGVAYTAEVAERIGFACCVKSCVDKGIALRRSAGTATHDRPEDHAYEDDTEEPVETSVLEPAGVDAQAEDDELDDCDRFEFECPECHKGYTMIEADRLGLFCAQESCRDRMILLDKANPTPGKPGGAISRSHEEIGLGVLICDVSGSMEDFPFPGRRVSKLSMVAGSVARGVWDLVELMVDSAKRNAYVALVYFAKDAELALDDDGLPFVKSIQEIGETFKSARDFAEFITDGMVQAQRKVSGGVVSDMLFGKDNTKNYTNLNAALALANRIKQSLLKGDMSEFGLQRKVKVIEDVCVSADGRTVLAPNVRCLLYSDGAHNYPRGSSVENPFDNDEPSVLLTAFIGSKTAKGSDQVEALAGVCPKHGERSFFLVDKPEGYHRLRGLFRMSSGSSGFCPSCLPSDY